MKKRRTPVVKPWQIAVAITLIVVAAIACLTWYLQGKNFAVLNPQGPVGLAERNLIVFTLLLSVIVVVPVFIMLFTFAWRYREGNTKAKYTPDADSNKWLETLWWGIPVFIIGILIAVTWVSTYQLDPYKPLASKVKPINVEVVALQWKWLFLYPDQQVASINELKIPVGTPIHFDITADAPMSAFFIPSLGTQTYAMTGMNSQLNLEADNIGVYRGENTNINGKGYADMTFKVDAISNQDFTNWYHAIINNPLHDHLDDDEYAGMVTPSIESAPSYYHLHDLKLYNRILDKYDGGSTGTMSMDSEAGDDE